MPTNVSTAARSITWRTPAVILICGCLVSAISFGPRSALGLFLTPMSVDLGWGRDVFAFAMGLQILVWGIALPVAGALADRYGNVRVLSVGAVVYFAGLSLMAYSTSPTGLAVTGGLLTGFGVAAASFTLVLAAFGKLMPENWRSLSFGLGTAAGSFGQFLFSPLAVGLIDGLGWQHALVALGAVVLLVIPLSFALSTRPSAAGAAPSPAQQQSLKQALAEAFGHRSYVLLVLGFFTCGFQLLFIAVHLPAYLVDRGLSADIGAWTLGTIGLFNIFGSVAAGWLGGRYPKRYVLAVIYLLRSAAVAAFILLPASPAATLAFGAFIGLLWLSTVPPTTGLVALMFGPKWMATLFGFAFLSHQIGGFLGVWLGGVLFEAYGTYDVIWWASVALGIASALINLPIIERPVARPVAAPA